MSGIALRNAIGGGPRLGRFWDSSTRVAQLCARLTKEFRGVSRPTACSFGLFHDCGIAVLMGRFPDYRETLQLANSTYDRRSADIEDERHDTNHAIARLLALPPSWGLPEEICNAAVAPSRPEHF